MAQIGGILWQEEAPTYDIAVPSSLARSFWSWLTASAGEYGYEVLPSTIALADHVI